MKSDANLFFTIRKLIVELSALACWCFAQLKKLLYWTAYWQWNLANEHTRISTVIIKQLISKKIILLALFLFCVIERALTVSWEDHAQRASSFVVWCVASAIVTLKWFISWIIHARNTIVNRNTQTVSPIFFLSEMGVWHRLKRNCAIILLCDSPLRLEKFTLSSCLTFLSCLHALLLCYKNIMTV